MSPAKATKMNGKETQEFWIGLGKEMGETKACAAHIAEKLDKFMSNDHVHLCADVKALDTNIRSEVKELDGKIDKLAIRIAYIVGGIMALEFAVQIGVRLLSK